VSVAGSEDAPDQCFCTKHTIQQLQLVKHLHTATTLTQIYADCSKKGGTLSKAITIVF
jgi:hypothetical protein